MGIKEFVWLGVFWAMQTTAMILFKWGSTESGRWLWGFAGGHVFGVSSIWILMVLYKSMNPNVAMGIALSGGFLCAQLGVALVYHSQLTFVQWAGLAAIVAGMMALSMGGRAHFV